MEFRAKPIVVTAVQWFPGVSVRDLYTDPLDLVGHHGATMADQRCIEEGAAILEKSAGVFDIVNSGDWIVWEGNGTVAIWSDDRFRDCYEPTADMSQLRFKGKPFYQPALSVEADPMDAPLEPVTKSVIETWWPMWSRYTPGVPPWRDSANRRMTVADLQDLAAAHGCVVVKRVSEGPDE